MLAAFLVSIQLVSPASGEAVAPVITVMYLTLLRWCVSIQLVSPASGERRI